MLIQTYTNTNLESSYVLKRTYYQITDTIRFEIIRHFKKTILMFSIFTGIFAIIFAYNIYTYSNPDYLLPTVPGQYIQSYLMVIGIMILVLAILFGDSIIVGDYESQTGNLLFPNVTKFRLLAGRTIAAFILGSACLVLFYFLITLDTIFEYGLFHVPIELFYSLFWAVLYYFTLLSLTILFSSFSKSTSIVIILMVVFVLVISNILEVLTTFAGYTGEPFFIITYLGNIITQILTYPAARHVIQPLKDIHVKINGKEVSYVQWLTPSPIEALFFMITYSAIFLILSYFLYERKQMQ